MKMERANIKSVLTKGEEGQQILICGWVRTKRVSKNFAFLELNDGSSQGNLQAIIEAGHSAFDSLKDVQTGASVKVEGLLRASPAKGQKWELAVSDLAILGTVPDDYPLQKKGHTLEFLREIAHLRGRTNTFGAIFRVRNAAARAMHQYFQERSFLWVHTPILTSCDAEGAGELFSVTVKAAAAEGREFFGKKAFLTVSGQLEGEFLALGLGNIYTFGPTFRAENSNTSRHLAEFWMIEPEMAFADLGVNMEVAEGFVRHTIRSLLAECGDELTFLAEHYKGVTLSSLETIANQEFGRITYTEAIRELKKAKKAFAFPTDWGVDLQSEHERYLAEEVFKRPVFVTDYPQENKAFYMRMNEDNKTVAAMDLLVPGVGEIIGGSQREERLDLLERRMDAMGIPKDDLQWYLDLRRYGSIPHSGFGLGFERLIMYVTGMGNVRDVIPCPRAPGLISF